MVQLFLRINPVWLGVLASLATGFFTGIGALPILITRKVPTKLLDSLLGFAAGVMLAATSFSLIIPAIESGGGGTRGAGICLMGILVGGMFVDLVDKFFPNTNLLQESEEGSSTLKRVWLFAIAITIHNFPEGMAVGVGFGGGNVMDGVGLAIAIGLQNLPEGLAVALPFVREGFSPLKAFGIALATGLVEPVGGAMGAGLVGIARPFLPFALSFAAGAMLFVIAREIIPETQTHGSSKLSTHMLLLGFVIMMFLDSVLG